MLPIISTSILAFTAVIILLVLLLIFAQKRLVQSGPVKITINGEKIITVSADSTAKVWDAENGDSLFILKDPGRRLQFARFSPDPHCAFELVQHFFECQGAKVGGL